MCGKYATTKFVAIWQLQQNKIIENETQFKMLHKNDKTTKRLKRTISIYDVYIME